jgi:23S rRNA (adenine2503-C2)-methyltransferase
MSPAMEAGGRIELLGLPREDWDREVGALLERIGERPYRSRQLLDWTFRRGAEGFGAMSDLPRGLREKLEEAAALHPLRLEEERVSSDGTRKYLWTRISGPGSIESVLIPDPRRPSARVPPAGVPPRGSLRTAPGVRFGGGTRPEDGRPRVTYCISTQAGCPVKCTFCATGHGGYLGNLRAAEIVDQVIGIRRLSGRAPTNIVYMGMGEPLLNFDATLRSLAVLADPDRLALGARRLSVSTVGVPAKIVELGRRFDQVKLAVSLHAARDDLRSELIPLNRKYPLADVLAAVREHREITGKMATFEYVVLPGVNDSERDAREIGRLLEGLPSRLNLIEFNPFAGVPYRRPEVKRLVEFRRLASRDFPGPITIRRSRGADIHGACGQLSLAVKGAPKA